MNLSDIEAAAGDSEQLHDLYAEAAAMPANRGEHLLTALRSALGRWPYPDTPPGDVLRYAGTPGVPVGRVLATEESRPARHQRPALIAALRRIADGLGPAATAVEPTKEALQARREQTGQ